MKNTTDYGQAAVSLDMYDAAAGGVLKIDGTYYRTDSDDIRVYGQLSTISSSLKAEKGGAEGTVAATADLVDSNKSIGQTTEGTSAAYAGKMTISAGSQFDLVVTLGTVSGTDYFFYAAQGVWNPSGTFSDSADVRTPWALAEASTS